MQAAVLSIKVYRQLVHTSHFVSHLVIIADAFLTWDKQITEIKKIASILFSYELILKLNPFEVVAFVTHVIARFSMFGTANLGDR